MIIDVLKAMKYDFKADDGKMLKGAKITCFMPGAPLNTDSTRGVDVVTLGADFDVFSQMPTIPGRYEVSHTLRTVKGEAKIHITSAKSAKAA